MKYYAVANDPTELMHYGVKGMKWGVIRTDAQLGHPRKPRSAAYKKAQSKLGKMMKSGIKKAQANWAKRTSPEVKMEKARKKAEKLFEKRLQQAREGRLRYKGLTDNDVNRITNRLILERNARSLSGAEKPSFVRRLKSAAGEGVLRGTTDYIEERMKGRGKSTAEIKRDKRMDEYYSRGDVQRRKAKRALAEEYYKTAYEEGERPKYKSASRIAKYMRDVKSKNKEKGYKENLQKIYDEQRERTRGTNAGKNYDDNYSKRLLKPTGALESLNSYNWQHESYNNYHNRKEAERARRQNDLKNTSTKRKKRKGYR